MRIWKDLTLIAILTIASIALVYILPSDSEAKVVPEEISVEPEVEAPVEDLLYGIPSSKYRIEYKQVKSRQLLSNILLKYGVSMRKIYDISLLPDTILDERKIKPGNRYAIFLENDSVATYFVYEKDQVNYVSVLLTGDSVSALNGKKPVNIVRQKASGTIEYSLWESMKESEVNPNLSFELSEIYAWSIDFFGLKEGDQYKVLYEEAFVDSLSVGINQITGAWFKHNGTEFWAIPFEQDSVRSFFDEEGNSLRKAFLKAPLRFSRISSGFSNSRLHPILKIYRPHHGIDYAAPVGTPVLTVGDGVVTTAGYSKGAGNYVKIKHNSIYTTSYLHLSRFGKGVKKGAYVKQGDVIGFVGSTGLSTGPHLDFRFYKNGSAVNPLRVEAPPVEPILENNRVAYNLIKKITMQSLKSFD